MNVWDYILAEDIISLSDSEYESFRNYLRFMGHKVSDVWGTKLVGHRYLYLKLYDDGDLTWTMKMYTDGNGGNRVPLEEVKRMAALGMAI